MSIRGPQAARKEGDLQEFGLLLWVVSQCQQVHFKLAKLAPGLDESEGDDFRQELHDLVLSVAAA